MVTNVSFLVGYIYGFLDNAGCLVSGAYCRIHRKIDMYQVSIASVDMPGLALIGFGCARWLNLLSDEGEKCREPHPGARMGADAKIDQKGHISQPVTKLALS